MKVVQIGLRLRVPSTEYRPSMASLAASLAQTPGIRTQWILLNEEVGTAGGVLLFEDELARDDFLCGPTLVRIRDAPFDGLAIRLFDLLPDCSTGIGLEQRSLHPPHQHGSI